MKVKILSTQHQSLHFIFLNNKLELLEMLFMPQSFMASTLVSHATYNLQAKAHKTYSLHYD
jgi:hypothetical protein